MPDFGICDIDRENCYANGAICRLNKVTGFQIDFEYVNPRVRMPFRNKKCSHFKNTKESKSEWEKSNK